MLERAPLFVVLAGALAVSIGCADTYDTVDLRDPMPWSPQDDTAPPPTTFDPALEFVDRDGYTENRSTTRYRFDVVPFANQAEADEAATLFPSHAAYLAAHPDALPSVQTVGTAMKQLDDTIYAGVEVAAQKGLAPTIPPKHEVLTGALDYLVAHRSKAADAAIAHVAAALELGGHAASVPPDLADAKDASKGEFLAAGWLSKPIGFYTWSNDLQLIWAQDRLLQRPLPTPEAACALAGAIAADPGRKQRYETLLGLYGRLTNPLSSSLADMLAVASSPSCPKKGLRAFLSGSESPEVELFERLYPEGIPPNANLMQDLVDAIRSGEVDLAPRPEDGFYAHQLYALETLLVTDRSEERAKVAFMARYKKRLQEAFETMLVQHRETHVKQLDVVEPRSTSMVSSALFRVEPLATVFVRHARSYVFLEAALDEVMGPELLDAGVAVDQEGPTAVSLRARIRASRDLFHGLYLIACQDIGLSPTLDRAGDPAEADRAPLAAAADQWLLGLQDEPAAKADVRVMIPIAILDEERARYWAVIGVRSTPAGYSLIEGMDVSPPPEKKQYRYPLPTERFIEVESSATPLTRDELRKLCDEQGTEEAIRAALEAR